MLIIVSAIALFAVCGAVYFKHQDYKDQKEKKQVA